MNINIDTVIELLSEFKKLPKTNIDTTFLEICSYPQRRFEEICSRILSFFFNPRKEHGLKRLFIDSLFELLKIDETFQHKEEQIKIVTEENANGKKIDLVIYSPDFIIGIENKIHAQLYNPLEVYKERLEEYSIENTIKLVLSLKKITKKEEIDLINTNDFIAITYADFFKVIKQNIGQYISSCNQKYLIQLYDFIQTLENMDSLSPTEKRISEFFFDNSSQIDNLISSYSDYQDRIFRIQKQKIAEIRETISKKTGRDWWVYQGWDLGIHSFNSKNPPDIGIESSFKHKRNDELGEFRIYITTWKLRDWLPYAEFLSARFPNNFLDKVNNRVYLHMDIINGNDEDLIIEKLKEYYDLLDEITK